MSVTQARLDLEGLRQKSAALQRELQDIEVRVVKLANYIEVADSYSQYDVAESALPERAAQLPARQAGRSKLPRNVQAVVDILEATGKPTPTRVLVERLVEQGIEIGGKLPVTGLSSALSRHKAILTASRSEGWSLTKWEREHHDADLLHDGVRTASP